jgi:hypothetical protein
MANAFNAKGMAEDVKRNAAKAGDGTKAKTENVTKLERVDPSGYYSADKDAGSVLGTDLEAALWNQYNNAGKGGSGGSKNAFGDLGNVQVQPRSKEFMDFQGQTTEYMSDLMKGAADQAEGMFGQGAYNQITGDNDIMVNRQIQDLEKQYAAKGMDATHPAFVKAKNEIIASSRMLNMRTLTTLKEKAGQYGVQVGELAKNFYDVFGSKEQAQQELQLAADQFNEKMKFDISKARMDYASSASARAFSQQMAALAAIAANRKFEADIGFQASVKELEARSADKITRMNWEMENRKIDAAMATAKAQQKNSIISSLLGLAGGVAGFLIGGPPGAAAGIGLGKAAAGAASSFSLSPYQGNTGFGDYTPKFDVE